MRTTVDSMHALNLPDELAAMGLYNVVVELVPFCYCCSPRPRKFSQWMEIKPVNYQYSELE